MFEKFIINNTLQANLFDLLSTSTNFEDITNGRKGAVLVNPDTDNTDGNTYDNENNLIPIVRTTSIYNNPVQQFLPIHYDIIENIKDICKYNNLYFNNALIEIYDSKYCKMKYHSDQALDLDENSYICLFSCYNNIMSKDLRKLKIKRKELQNEKDDMEVDRKDDREVDIILDNNSIILFSVKTNREYLHKIILDSNMSKDISNDKWLGITFRLSKTFIHFINEIPFFYSSKSNKESNNKILVMADDIQKKEYYKYRNLENINIIYTYPDITYTISISDTLPMN